MSEQAGRESRRFETTVLKVETERSRYLLALVRGRAELRVSGAGAVDRRLQFVGLQLFQQLLRLF